MADFSLAGMTIPDTTIVRCSDDSIATQVDEETVILNSSTGTYSSLDATGSVIWNHLQEPISLAGLVDRIREEYNVEEPRCITDLEGFLEDLLANRLIVIRDTSEPDSPDR